MSIRAALVLLAAALPELAGSARAADEASRPTIIGGTIAPDGRWPFVVGLLSAAEASNLAAQFCAGALIDRSHVLTAAHCVAGMAAADLAVLVGTQDLSDGGRRIAVARIVVHPYYDAGSSDSDVAVIRLAAPVAGVRPVAVLDREKEARRAPAGTLAMTMGWGDIDRSPRAVFPARMRQARVRIFGNRRCNGDAVYAGQLTRRMLCAGTLDGSRDACQGDSGGPLIVPDAKGRLRLQAGIVSWGYGCAEPGFPGVYTRVAAVSGWIAAVLARGR